MFVDYKKEMKCVYCEANANSLEHVLPAAYGEFKGAPLLRDRLCQTCNHKLGVLDEALTRTGTEAVRRRFYGVKGRSHHDTVNPFARGSAKSPRIVATGRDTQTLEEVSLEFNDGAMKRLPEISFKNDHTGEIHRFILAGKKNAQDLRKFLNDVGLSRSSSVRALVPPDEIRRVRDMVMELSPGLREGEDSGPAPMWINNISIQTLVGEEFWRGVAKVGSTTFCRNTKSIPVTKSYLNLSVASSVTVRRVFNSPG